MLRWAVALVLAAFVVAACGGDNNEHATPSLDAAAYQRGYDQLGTMLDRASTGDVEGAEEAFAQVLALTRLVSEALAALPQEVITLAALADAAEALGVERPHD